MGWGWEVCSVSFRSVKLQLTRNPKQQAHLGFPASWATAPGARRASRRVWAAPLAGFGRTRRRGPRSEGSASPGSGPAWVPRRRATALPGRSSDPPSPKARRRPQDLATYIKKKGVAQASNSRGIVVAVAAEAGHASLVFSIWV